MTREEVQHALTKMNDSIAQLESRLHPPPLDPVERNELEAELAAAEQARDALEQALNNLPASAPSAALRMAPMAARKAVAKHKKAENQASIKLSQATRKRADALVAMMQPVNPPDVKKPKKKV